MREILMALSGLIPPENRVNDADDREVMAAVRYQVQAFIIRLQTRLKSHVRKKLELTEDVVMEMIDVENNTCIARLPEEHRHHYDRKVREYIEWWIAEGERRRSAD